MQQHCDTCGNVFDLSQVQLALYQKFGMEPLRECFQCNQQHKLSFRNGRTLYRRTCDATKESIISVYPKDAPFPVYKREYWFSDAWDAASYAQEIDFHRPFFVQLKELQQRVPHMALFNVDPENSEYCNMAYRNKDCYCVFGGDHNDGVLYSILCMHNRSCVDCDYSNHNELCYDVFNSFECYGCRTAIDSKNCSDCAYISDCVGCKDCILCTNLVNKQYCIQNQSLSREEYERQKGKLVNGSQRVREASVREFLDLRARRITKYAHIIACEDCTGDYLENSKGCHRCFFASDSEDVTDAIFVADAKDSLLSSFFGHKSELCYQCMSTVGSNRCSFCFAVADSSELFYCDNVMNSQHCFGCVGLRHKRYCILNKQYTKEEYEALMPKIMEHMKAGHEWGQFFPKDHSCFAYNESTAHEYFPLTSAAAKQLGFRWRDPEEEDLQVERIIDAAQLPDAIEETPDDVINWAIRSERTKRPFRIVKQELAFYRTNNLPLPRVHPDERFNVRFGTYANRPCIYTRSCEKCEKEIMTTYAPDRPEIVYCEECYLKEVY